MRSGTTKWLLTGAELLAPAAGAQAQSLDQAAVAYSHYRVADAQAQLAAVARSATDPGERARAYRELARIHWHLYGDTDRALALVHQANALGEGQCENASLLARILHEGDGDARLLTDADALIQECALPGDASPIRLAGASAALEAAAQIPLHRPSLDRAKILLDGLDEDARSSLAGASLRLQLSILLEDPAGALKAWKDYFWLPDDRDVPQALAAIYPSAAQQFAAALGPDADAQSRVALVDLLVRAGFAAAAERFGTAQRLGEVAGSHRRWLKASAYFSARKELEAVILQSNRVVAQGGQAVDLAAAVDRFRAALLAAVPGGSADAVLEAEYGLRGQLGNDDGYAGVHYGHVIQNERLQIEQYGHRANVNFVALDNMISNGFNSWFWDGRAARGGWTEADQTIVQIRPLYTTNPLAGWGLYSQGGGERGNGGRDENRSLTDAAAVRATGAVYMPALADRLEMQAVDQIGNRARAQAPGGDLRSAFLREYWRGALQGFIAHEGRRSTGCWFGALRCSMIPTWNIARSSQRSPSPTTPAWR